MSHVSVGDDAKIVEGTASLAILGLEEGAALMDILGIPDAYASLLNPANNPNKESDGQK